MCCCAAAQRARRRGRVRCVVLARLHVGSQRPCRGGRGLILSRRIHMAQPRRCGQWARVRISKERVARRCRGHSADRDVHSFPMRGRSTRVDVLCLAGNFGHALGATRGRAQGPISRGPPLRAHTTGSVRAHIQQRTYAQRPTSYRDRIGLAVWRAMGCGLGHGV